MGSLSFHAPSGPQLVVADWPSLGFDEVVSDSGKKTLDTHSLLLISNRLCGGYLFCNQNHCKYNIIIEGLLGTLRDID